MCCFRIGTFQKPKKFQATPTKGFFSKLSTSTSVLFIYNTESTIVMAWKNVSKICRFYLVCSEPFFFHLPTLFGNKLSAQGSLGNLLLSLKIKSCLVTNQTKPFQHYPYFESIICCRRCQNFTTTERVLAR